MVGPFEQLAAAMVGASGTARPVTGACQPILRCDPVSKPPLGIRRTVPSVAALLRAAPRCGVTGIAAKRALSVCEQRSGHNSSPEGPRGRAELGRSALPSLRVVRKRAHVQRWLWWLILIFCVHRSTLFITKSFLKDSILYNIYYFLCGNASSCRCAAHQLG